MSDSVEPISKRLRPRSAAIKPQSAQPFTRQQAHPQPQPQSTNQSAGINPSPNAPPNSLLRLDDKCLAKLFEYFDAEMLCTLANTCKRFRAIAEKVFSEQLKEFECPGTYDSSKLRRVVRKFGRFITSFDAGDFYVLDPIDIEAIAKYCRPNLRKISLVQTKIDCNVVKPLFPQLTDVSFDGCDFVGNPNDLFKNCPNLEHLYFDPGAEGDDFKFLVRNYPKLDQLAIDCGPPTYGIIHPMLKSNPQIKKLTLMAMADDYLISDVFECTKNVEQLTIEPNGMFKRPKAQTKGVLVKLGKLKKLTHLTMDVGCQEYAKLIGPLAEAFAKANVPLEELDLNGVYIGSKDIKSINKLKTLKRLLLSEMRNDKEADLISLTVNLPALVELQLFFGYEIDKAITVDGLVNIIKNAKHLEFLGLIGVRNLRIDQAAFEKLLNAVSIEQGKFTIHIIGCKATTGLNVPENIQKTNAKRLEIVHKEDSGDRCECEHCEEEEE